jgi:hypothetical protein
MDSIEFFWFSVTIFVMVIGYIAIRDRKQFFTKKENKENLVEQAANML